MAITIVLPENHITKAEIERVRRQDSIKKKGGVYFFYDDRDILMYVGKAKCLSSRINQHMNSSDKNTTAASSSTHNVKHNLKKCSLFLCEDELDREIYETYAINTLKPKLNRAKVITYVSEHYSDEYRMAKSNEELVREKEMEERLRNFNIFK